MTKDPDPPGPHICPYPECKDKYEFATFALKCKHIARAHFNKPKDKKK